MAKKVDLLDVEFIESLKLAEVHLVPINKLVINSWNPNEMGETAWQALGQSITKYGIHLQPLVVREVGSRLQIIDGEHRYKWALEMGITEVSAIIIDVDDFNAKKLTQILNRTRGEDNPVQLKELLDSLLVDHDPAEVIEGMAIANSNELEALLADLEDQITNDYGLEEDSGYEGLTDADEVPEDVPTRCKRGDIWQLGRHRLMCGDSTSIDDVRRLMNGQVADMVFTDPPYGISIVKGKSRSGSVGGGGATKFGSVGGEQIVKAKTYAKIENDETTDCAREFYSTCIAVGFSNYIIWGGNYFTDFLSPKACWIVWDKQNTGNFADVELAWTSFDKGAKLYSFMWNGLARAGDRKSELVFRVHPTQKPVGLFENIFQDFTFTTCYDGFLGSGSTLIACEKTGRICYGMELSEKYCDVIIKRWEDFTGGEAKLIS